MGYAYEEDGRLPNFADLASINSAMLVPPIVIAILATMLFKHVARRCIGIDTQNASSHSIQLCVVFLTTLLDLANVIVALTLQTTSPSDSVQIGGSLTHGLTGFFWKRSCYILQPCRCPPIPCHCKPVCHCWRSAGDDGNRDDPSGRILSSFHQPHCACQRSLATMTISMRRMTSRKRMPKLYADQLSHLEQCYISGVVTIATVQDCRNIYLLFPAVTQPKTLQERS